MNTVVSKDGTSIGYTVTGAMVRKTQVQGVLDARIFDHPGCPGILAFARNAAWPLDIGYRGVYSSVGMGFGALVL